MAKIISMAPLTNKDRRKNIKPRANNIAIMDRDILNSLPAMIAWKDPNSVFIDGNLQAAKFAGFKSPAQLSGLTDYEIKSKVSEYADQFIEQDKQVITENRTIEILGIHAYEDGITRTLMTTKKPLQKSGKTHGLLYHSSIISNDFIINFSKKLLRLDHYYTTFKGQRCYHIQEAYDQHNLSPKESECLFYLLRGMPSGKIAKLLNISKRTVETHLSHIKTKMNCCFLHEVIEKGIAEGYLFMIPKSFMLSK